MRRAQISSRFPAFFLLFCLTFFKTSCLISRLVRLCSRAHTELPHTLGCGHSRRLTVSSYQVPAGAHSIFALSAQGTCCSISACISRAIVARKVCVYSIFEHKNQGHHTVAKHDRFVDVRGSVARSVFRIFRGRRSIRSARGIMDKKVLNKR